MTAFIDDYRDAYGVELRLGEICRRFAQDLIGVAKFTVLPFKLLDPGSLIARHTLAPPQINFSSSNPFAKCLGCATDFGRD